MTELELSRTVKIRAIKHEPVVIEASEAEREALADRFAITRVDSLRAEITLDPEGQKIAASGTLKAAITQACAISGDDFSIPINERVDFIFVPAGQTQVGEEGEEIELEREQLDEIEYDGESFDLGEAVAQSLALAIDPYAEGPNADAVRAKAGIVSEDEVEPSGPLAEALKGLSKS